MAMLKTACIEHLNESLICIVIEYIRHDPQYIHPGSKICLTQHLQSFHGTMTCPILFKNKRPTLYIAYLKPQWQDALNPDVRHHDNLILVILNQYPADFLTFGIRP